MSFSIAIAVILTDYIAKNMRMPYRSQFGLCPL